MGGETGGAGSDSGGKGGESSGGGKGSESSAGPGYTPSPPSMDMLTPASSAPAAPSLGGYDPGGGLGLPDMGGGGYDPGGFSSGIGSTSALGYAGGPDYFGETFGQVGGAEPSFNTGGVTPDSMPGISATSATPWEYDGSSLLGPNLQDFSLPEGAAPGAMSPDPTSAIGSTGGTSVFDIGTSTIPGLDGTGMASPPAAPASTSAGTTGGGSLLDTVVSGVKANPIGTAISAAGLGYNMMKQQAGDKEAAKMRSSADALAAQGAELRSYIQSGQTPPALKAAVDQATAAAKARIVQNHASRGMPVNPAKNTALAQELAALEMNAAASSAQIATQLLAQGTSQTNMANQIYESLIKIDRSSAESTGKAIANFAAALGGSGGKSTQKGGLNINIG